MLKWSPGSSMVSQCRVCGVRGEMALELSASHITELHTDVQFVRCPACASLSNVDEILDFEHIEDGSVDTFLRQYLENTAGLWEMFWPPASLRDRAGKSFLDVGCGFGFTADAWRTVVNPEAYGCDPAPYASAGRRLLGPHIFQALLDDVEALRGRRFDIVYSSEVIEHVPDPAAFVRLLASRLTDSGTLVLTTPAADFVQPQSDVATTEAALAAGYHAFLFSRAALEKLLRASGLQHVIVERHNERLIAWASNVEIDRVAPDMLVPLYLRYLVEAAKRAERHTDASGSSLRSGLAYRAFKESLVRGHFDDLPTLRDAAMANLIIGEDGHALDVSTLRERIASVAAGPGAFGQIARFHLPQVAFLNGVYAEQFERRQDRAIAWLELALESTEKLCGPSVLHGLEAAMFYWHALQRLLAYDLASGRFDSAARRLGDLIESLVQPSPLLGGAAADLTQTQTYFNEVVDAMALRGQHLALRKLSTAMAGLSPQYVTGDQAVALSVAQRATQLYLMLHAQRIEGDAIGAQQAFAGIVKCSETPGAERWSRHIASIARELLATPSFMVPASFAELAAARAVHPVASG